MGKKKKKAELDVDLINTTELAKKKLVKVAVAVKDEIDKEIELGEQFRIEKEKIIFDWKIDRKKEMELLSQLRNSEKTNEEERAKAQDRLYKVTQCDKHIMFEMNEKLIKFKMDLETNHQNILTECKMQEDQLLREKSELEVQLQEQTSSWGERLRNVVLQHANVLNTIKEDFEIALKEHIILSEADLEHTLNTYERKRMNIVNAAEDRKNEQIDELLQKQRQEFGDLRMYYNNILSNNLSLIDSLKQEAEDLNAITERSKNFANDAVSKYNNLCEKYDKTLAIIKEYNEASKNLEKYQEELAIVTEKFEDLSKGRTTLMWSNAILEQVYDRTSRQVAVLQKSNEEVTLEVEMKKAFMQTVRCWNSVHKYTKDPNVQCICRGA